jgi:hypothetical protein
VGLELCRVETFTCCAGTLDTWVALVFACASAALVALAAVSGLAETTFTALDADGTETPAGFTDGVLGVAVFAEAMFAFAAGAVLAFAATGFIFAGVDADGF